MSKVPLSLALRLLARDWRSGEVVVLVAALVVAVAAISSVTFFTDRVRQAVAQQAGESLAADLRVEADGPLPDMYRELARAHDVAMAEIVSFRSVVVAGEATALADVRGVTAGYPLRGRVEIADRLGAVPYGASGIPPRGELWAEPSLLARLGAAVGDDVEVGRLTLRVAHTLEFRPDEGWRFMEVAPTALLNMDDVRDAGLLGPGSVAEYELLFAGEALQIRAFRDELEPTLERGTELEDFRSGRPEVRASVTNAERFLVLAALVSVLLGAVAVAIAARRFVARRLDAVALMKCLGARYADVLRMQIVQLALLVAAAAAVGTAIGFAAQLGLTVLLADFVEASLPAPSWRGALLGPVTALAVALGCAFPPLATLGAVPPARVLRSDVAPPPLRYSTIYGAATAGIGALLYLLFRDLELIVYVLGGAAATFAALYWAGRLLVLALGRLRGGVGVAWRYGISNIARRGRESSVQLVAFGIGLMVLLLLSLLRTELMVEWQATLPTGAPNHFLINIQPGEVDSLAATLRDNGVEAPEFTPLVRARITHVNARPAAEHRTRSPRGRNELDDEINLTWRAQLSADNDVVAGEWWDGVPPRPELSLEADMLRELGLAIGDVVTYAIGGEPLTATITSARRVRWESFRPNFFMVLSPGEIEQHAHTFITSFHVAPESRAVTVDIVRRFPGVSVIDIGAVLDQVRRAMERATLAVQYVFLFTVAAGIMVLLAAIQATRDERLFESAVLRTLGARRATILQGVAAEFFVLGSLAGILAAAGASGLAYLIATRLFDLDYTPGAWVWLGGLGAGALLVGVSGTLAIRAVVNESPVATLRGA